MDSKFRNRNHPLHLFLFLLWCLPSWGQTPLDFTLTASGPEHVVQGHFTHFLVTGIVTAGTDENVEPSITGLPAGATATFPNMLDPKMCCVTFIWGIAGVNPVKVDTTAATPVGTYLLVVKFTSKVTNVTRTVVHRLIVDPVPSPMPLATFPIDVPLTGLPQYEADMTKFATLHCVATELTNYEGFVWYYDGIRVYYGITNYTKDAKWLDCAKSIADWYSGFVISRNGGVPGYEAFALGLSQMFAKNGTPGYRDAVLAMMQNGYASFGNIAEVIPWTRSREISYALDTHFVAESLGNPRQPNFQTLVELLLGYFDQWFVTKNAPYTQAFMVALAAEPLITYWDLTHDPRVIPALQLAADELWRVSFDPVSQSFWYYRNDGTPASPVCSSDQDPAPCRITSVDLNLLIAPLYGWVYHNTGLRIYRDHGDQLFNAGVAGAWLFGGKQFSQNYRWSGRYLEWRKSPAFTVWGVAGSQWVSLQCWLGTVLKTGVPVGCTVQ